MADFGIKWLSVPLSLKQGTYYSHPKPKHDFIPPVAHTHHYVLTAKPNYSSHYFDPRKFLTVEFGHFSLGVGNLCHPNSSFMTQESLPGSSRCFPGYQRKFLSMQEGSRGLLQRSNALVTRSKELLLCPFSGFWLEFWSVFWILARIFAPTWPFESGSGKCTSPKLVFHDPETLSGAPRWLFGSQRVFLSMQEGSRGLIQRSKLLIIRLQRATIVLVFRILTRILI